MKERGVYHVFRRIFPVSQFQKNTLGNLRCFRKLPAGKIFLESEGGYHVFPSNFFSLTLPKTFIGNFSVFQNFRLAKKFCREEKGGNHVFPSHFFCIAVLRTYNRNELLFQKTSGRVKYFMKARWDITFSRLVFLVSYYRKLPLGTLRRCKLFMVAKRLY